MNQEIHYSALKIDEIETLADKKEATICSQTSKHGFIQLFTNPYNQHENIQTFLKNTDGSDAYFEHI